MSGGSSRPNSRSPRNFRRCSCVNSLTTPSSPTLLASVTAAPDGTSETFTASLDFANEPLDFESFLKTLERTAQETIFAPVSQDAQVQVMGVYAASGQSFDAVWFLGATDSAWPASGRQIPPRSRR